MKPKLLVHGSYARTISDPAEVERLLSQGWLLAAPKPRTKDARRMRAMGTRRRASGWKTQQIWMTAEQHAAIRAAKRPGESTVALLMRLIEDSLL